MRVSWVSSQSATRKCEAHFQGTLLGDHGRGTRGSPDCDRGRTSASLAAESRLHIREGLVGEGIVLAHALIERLVTTSVAGPQSSLVILISSCLTQ